MGREFFHRRTDPLAPEAKARATLVWDIYCELDTTQWAPASEVAEHQLKLARGIAAHAMKFVPHYRATFAAAGVEPDAIRSSDDFRKLPILKRRECRDHADQLVAERLPAGHIPVGEIFTSGTSGVPIRVKQTSLVQMFWQALLLRDMEWQSFDPRLNLAIIRMQASSEEGKSRTSWGRPLSDIIETGTSHSMRISAPLERQVEWLLRIRPELLLSYSTNLVALAGLFEERGLTLPELKAIQSISESLDAESQARIERVFGVPVRDVYTCQEAGYLASRCPESSLYHVHAESALVEVVDEEGRPCRPGERGRVLITTLRNFQSPFIRYEIGDYAIVGGDCPCGRGLPTLERIEGKERPFFILPDGRRKHTSTLPMPISKLPGVRQYQILQEAVDRVAVRIVPGAAWEDASRETIRRLIHDFFEAPIQVDVETVDSLERTAGGKLSCVATLVAPR
jgi:phenylacetate-CoA ligase